MAFARRRPHQWAGRGRRPSAQPTAAKRSLEARDAAKRQVPAAFGMTIAVTTGTMALELPKRDG